MPDFLNDYRVDPFTGDPLPQFIPEEFHRVRLHQQLGWPFVRLIEDPYRMPGDPLSNWISILAWDGAAYTIPFTVIDQSLEPSASEYKVAWDPLGNGPRALLKFNTADLNTDLKIEYHGLGSILAADTYSSLQVGCLIPFFINATGATVAEMRNFGFAVCDGTTPASQGIGDAVWTGPTPLLYEEVSPGVWEYRHLVSGPEGMNGLVQTWAVPYHSHDTVPLTLDNRLFINSPDINQTGTPALHTQPSSGGADDLRYGASFGPPPGGGSVIAPTNMRLLDATITGELGDPEQLTGHVDLTGHLQEEVRPNQIFCLPLLKVK